MWELAVIVLRLAQYGSASILAGSALFLVYALPAGGRASAAARSWPKPVLAAAALTLTAASMLGLLAQTAVLAGSLSEALRAESLAAVIEMGLGKSAIARAMLACLAAGLVLAMPRGRSLWLAVGSLGSLATVTFAWMGHGAVTEGAGHDLHLIADILHSLAAALWIGALVGFLAMLFGRDAEQDAPQLHDALGRFSTVGVWAVFTLVATGLVNSWFLVGTDFGAAASANYGRVLAIKLLLFAGMLVVAALHRFRLVGALRRELGSGSTRLPKALRTLRRTMLLEAAFGVAVLAAVAWLGTLEPPTML